MLIWGNIKSKLTIKNIVFTAFWIVLSLVIIRIGYIWALGLQGQIKGLLIDASSEYSMLKDLAFAIKEYGTIALSLFGITLLGGIFDLHKEQKNREGVITSNATTIIFGISIMFLISFICLFLVYSLIYPYILTEDTTLILGLLQWGLGLFIGGIISLLLIWTVYFMGISLYKSDRQQN